MARRHWTPQATLHSSCVHFAPFLKQRIEMSIFFRLDYKMASETESMNKYDKKAGEHKILSYFGNPCITAYSIGMSVRSMRSHFTTRSIEMSFYLYSTAKKQTIAPKFTTKVDPVWKFLGTLCIYAPI